MNRPFKYCTDCGHWLGARAWPITCKQCSATHYLNPLPVAALIIQTSYGVLTIRRRLAPGKGKLALPGGFIAVGESWQQAAAREVLEETGMEVQPGQVSLFDTVSAPDGTVLIFGEVRNTQDMAAHSFEPNEEVEGLAWVTEPTELAFPIHTRILRDWFERKTSAA